MKPLTQRVEKNIKDKVGDDLNLCSTDTLIASKAALMKTEKMMLDSKISELREIYKKGKDVCPKSVGFFKRLARLFE